MLCREDQRVDTANTAKDSTGGRVSGINRRFVLKHIAFGYA